MSYAKEEVKKITKGLLFGGFLFIVIVGGICYWLKTPYYFGWLYTIVICCITFYWIGKLWGYIE